MNLYRYRLWAAVLPALCVPFAAALLYFVICGNPDTARGIYAGAKIFLVVWPLAASLFILRGRPSSWRSERVRRLPAAVAGLACGAAMSLLIFGVMLTPLGGLVTAGADSIRERSAHLGILEHYWTFGVFLAVLHSLMEEYYWRWFTFGALRGRLGLRAAAAISSAAFASHHVIITAQLMSLPLGILCGAAIACGGFLWALLYERYGSLLAPWLAHVVVDFAVMAVGYRVITGGG